MKHKTLYLSSATDPAPFGKRLTYCRIEIESVDVNSRWETVTCEKCWAMKSFVPKKETKIDKGYMFERNRNGFIDRGRRVYK